VSGAMPGPLQGVAHWAMTELVERLNLQLTGGSTSIMGYTETLRLAGASAREAMCKAAARKWGVDWADCDTQDGFVVHKANRIAFGEIAAAAAEEEVSDEPALRKTPRLIGQSVPRLDTPSKTDGTARFGADVRLPGMVYAAIRQGPVAGGKVKSVDPKPAMARAGVIKVVEEATFVAVVADTWWGAKTALDATPVTFEAGTDKPAGPWIEKALADGLSADPEGDTVKLVHEAGVMPGKATVTATYGVPFLAHACMEPMTATARIVDGRVEVFAPVQSNTLAVWAVARALDIEDSAVTVFPTLLGGGFGRKAENDHVVQSALIARAVEKPVQLIWSREEDTTQDKYRPAAKARFSATISADKRIESWDCTIAVPSVGTSFMNRNLPAMGGDPGPNGQAIEGAAEIPYAVPNQRIRHSHVDVPVPLGFWRSVGHSYTGFFVESFVDEAARAAGVDPLTFRLRMLEDKPRHAEVLKAAASAAGFMAEGEDGRGQGIAVHESFGSFVAQVVDVEVKAGALEVKRVVCAVDCGRVINPDIVKQQMEGGILFGLSAALHEAITFVNGAAQQSNFDGFPMLTMAETPEIEVIIVESDAASGGCGEPGTPPVAAALANAVFAATGKRVRQLPFAGQALA
jgi:isoquinoline 1-oxidoreductase subunit beta